MKAYGQMAETYYCRDTGEEKISIWEIFESEERVHSEEESLQGGLLIEWCY